MSKYIKVMFGNKGANYEYEIDKINVASTWNPTAKSGKDFGGFNFSVENMIIRYIHRGDILYDVIIPENTEVVDVMESATPNGVFRSNKIIVTNPRPVTDKLALELYKKSVLPEMSYYKTLGAVAIMDYKETALQILRDKVNEDNIDTVINEWNDFINRPDRIEKNETVKLIARALNEIKDNRLITMHISREPYIKKLTNDKVLNITGQSGAGKSSYSKQYQNNVNYLVIDTDLVFSEQQKDASAGINKELYTYFKKKYKTPPSLSEDFDLIYDEILNYCKDKNKTIIIDCAQIHQIKDITKLKGELIILRTSIDTCYSRCLERYIQQVKEFDKEKYDIYAQRKLALYSWYNDSNEFIKRIDEIQV